MSRRSRKTGTTRVALTNRAIVDLRGIEEYSIKQWGRPTADQYLGEIESALDMLQADPRILRQQPHFACDLYFHRVRKHLLVCDYRDDLILN